METTFRRMFIVLLKLHGHSFSEFGLSSFFASHLFVKGILRFL